MSKLKTTEKELVRTKAELARLEHAFIRNASIAFMAAHITRGAYNEDRIIQSVAMATQMAAFIMSGVKDD